LERCGETPVSGGITLAALLRRPAIHYSDISCVDIGREILPSRVGEEAEIAIKYAGYLARQLSAVARQLRLEDMPLPETLSYTEVEGLRIEAQIKLDAVKPRSLGQASRISGVSPADIQVLTIWISRHRYLFNRGQQ
ncbi:MAG: tRNA uridine-5-carboxymethylaminomethyl(34) synthesis enzyme MnmG, partial [Oscillospiraceae bacterium]